MKQIWNYIDQKKWRVITKYRAAFLIFGLISALIGFAVWLVIRNWALSTTDWMLCFIGYPVVISWLVIVFYSCKHNFRSR